MMRISNKAAGAAFAAVLALAALGTLAGCGRGADKGKNAPAGLPVAAVNASRGDITATFSLTGVVAARQQATLSSVVSGNVQDVYVKLGERVHAGQLLVKIDDSTLRAQAAQAAARLAQVRANDIGGSSTAQANLISAKVANDNAQTALLRDQRLYQQGYVSKSALQQSENTAAAAAAAYRSAQVAAQNANLQSGSDTAAVADINAAKAALDAIDAQIAQTNVSAPFNGVITQRSVDRGALASPGTALVTVSQLDPSWVNVGIPDDDLAYVHTGTPVDISVDSLPGRVWHAHVDIVNAAASSGTLSYLTHIVVPNPDLTLRAGMVANVTIQQATHRGVVLLPRSAIYQTDTGSAVYVIEDGKAKSVPVKTGLQTQEKVEVQGIQPGVQVITQRPDSLQDGSVVSVVSPEGAAQPSSSPTSR